MENKNVGRHANGVKAQKDDALTDAYDNNRVRISICYFIYLFIVFTFHPDIAIAKFRTKLKNYCQELL